MSDAKKVVIGIIIAVAVISVVAIKLTVKDQAPNAEKTPGAAAASGYPTVYLFYNAEDQDSGCKSIYDAFDQARSSFPKGIQSTKINAGENEPLFQKYSVRVLPTVLFVDSKDEVKERIEGEGKEIERRLSGAFARAADILKP